MQSRLTWLVFAILAVGIMSIGIVGCGGDTEEESAEKPTESSSTTSSAETTVAARPPIDFDAEKPAIQEVYSAFYAAFNDEDIPGIQETFETSKIQFGTIFAGNEPCTDSDRLEQCQNQYLRFVGRHRYKGCQMGTGRQVGRFLDWL